MVSSLLAAAALPTSSLLQPSDFIHPVFPSCTRPSGKRATRELPANGARCMAAAPGHVGVDAEPIPRQKRRERRAGWQLLRHRSIRLQEGGPGMKVPALANADSRTNSRQIAAHKFRLGSPREEAGEHHNCERSNLER